jgi:hypothetical protein
LFVAQAGSGVDSCEHAEHVVSALHASSWLQQLAPKQRSHAPASGAMPHTSLVVPSGPEVDASLRAGVPELEPETEPELAPASSPGLVASFGWPPEEQPGPAQSNAVDTVATSDARRRAAGVERHFEGRVTLSNECIDVPPASSSW